MEELTHTLYPIIFDPGTFGSSLGHLISLHDGFYPFIFEPDINSDGSVMTNYEAIPRIEHTVKEINDQFCSIDRNKKIVCKFEGTHNHLPSKLHDYVGKKIFPIIIERNIHSALFNYIRVEYGYNTRFCNLEKLSSEIDHLMFQVYNWKKNPSVLLKNIVNNPKFKNGTDYFLTDIFFFSKLLNNDITFYNSLLNFIKSNKRLIFDDAKNIDKMVKYSSIKIKYLEMIDEFNFN